jgi:hypothetical protein
MKVRLSCPELPSLWMGHVVTRLQSIQWPSAHPCDLIDPCKHLSLRPPRFVHLSLPSVEIPLLSVTGDLLVMTSSGVGFVFIVLEFSAPLHPL